MIKTLAPLYNRSVRITGNLLPSIPAAAACVEAGVLSFEWYAALNIFKRALNYLEKTSGGNYGLLQIAKDIHRTFTGKALPKLARLQRVTKRPWYVEDLHIDTSLAVSTGANPQPRMAAPTSSNS